MLRGQGQGEADAFQGFFGLVVAKIGLGHVVVDVLVLGTQLDGLEIGLNGLLVLLFLAQPDAQCVVGVGRIDVVFDDFDENFLDLGEIVQLCVLFSRLLQVEAVAVRVVLAQVGPREAFVGLDERLVAGQGLVEGQDGLGPLLLHQELAALEEILAGQVFLVADDHGQIADGVFKAALGDHGVGQVDGFPFAVLEVVELFGLQHVVLEGRQVVGAQDQARAAGGDHGQHELLGAFGGDDQDVQELRCADFAQGRDEFGQGEILDLSVDDDDPRRVVFDELRGRPARGEAGAVGVAKPGEVAPGFLEQGVLARGHENEIRHVHPGWSR